VVFPESSAFTTNGTVFRITIHDFGLSALACGRPHPVTTGARLIVSKATAQVRTRLLVFGNVTIPNFRSDYGLPPASDLANLAEASTLAARPAITNSHECLTPSSGVDYDPRHVSIIVLRLRWSIELRARFHNARGSND